MEHHEILKFLSNLPLFKSTAKEALDAALCAQGSRILTVGTGERVEMQSGKHLGVLLRGRAQIRSTDGERTVILRTLREGDVFGAASLFLQEAPPLSRIEASESCTALFLDLQTVRALMQRDPGFMDAYLSFLAGRVQFLNQKIRCFTAGSTERRVALWLASQGEGEFSLADSLIALSDTLDIGRASLYRALDKLEANGLISRSGRNITVISQDRILQKYQ